MRVLGNSDTEAVLPPERECLPRLPAGVLEVIRADWLGSEISRWRLENRDELLGWKSSWSPNP